MKSWLESNDTEISENVRYWTDLWEELTENFTKNIYGLEFSSPHLLLKDIIDEIQFNDLSSDYVKKNFYQKLKEIKSKDPAFRENFEIELEFIGKILNKPTTSYLLFLCKDLLNQFEEGKYFDVASEKLIDTLLKENWEEEDEKNIKIITQHLILELFLKGYAIEEIKDIPSNLMDGFHEIPEAKEDLIVTDFPHNLNIEDFEDREEYNEALKVIINNLDLEERLEKIREYYYADEKSYYYTFPVKGLKGKDVDIDLGKVQFYSLNKRRYLKSGLGADSDINPEEFHRDEDDAVNVAVEIDTLDIKSSMQKAVSVANRAINLIHLYFHTETELEVNDSRFLVVNKNGNLVLSSDSSEDQEWYKKRMALDFSQKDPSSKLKDELVRKAKDFLYLPESEQKEIESKITNSLHWFTKAEETDNIEDKLLNYWISMENLINFTPSTDNLLPPQAQNNKSNYADVKSLLLPIQVMNYIPQVGWRLYYYLRNLVDPVPIIDLSDDLKKDLQLDVFCN